MKMPHAPLVQSRRRPGVSGMGGRLATPQSVSITARVRDRCSPDCEAVEPTHKVDLLAECVDFGLRAVEACCAAPEGEAEPHKVFIYIESRSPLLLRHWQEAIKEAVRDWRAERAERKGHVAWTILLCGDDRTNLSLYRLRYTLSVTTGPFDTGHFTDVDNPGARVRLL